MPRFGARHDLRSLRGAAKSAPKSRAAQPETTQRSGRPFVVKNQNCFLTLKFKVLLGKFTGPAAGAHDDDGFGIELMIGQGLIQEQSYHVQCPPHLVIATHLTF